MHGSWTPYGDYLKMLWLLSIGIMLEYDDNVIHELLMLIDKKEVKDRVYDVLLNYRFPERKKLADCVFDNIPYRAILEVSDLAKTDKTQAIKRLEKYLKKSGIVDTPIIIGITTINMVLYMTAIGALKAVHWLRFWGWMIAV